MERGGGKRQGDRDIVALMMERERERAVGVGPSISFWLLLFATTFWLYIIVST
jgi:hypothetical protein